MITTTLTDFRKEMKQYLDRITDQMETLIINRGKDKGIVILSVEEYNQIVNHREVSKPLSRAEISSIKRGEEDVKAGRTLPHSEVMKLFKEYGND